MNELKRCLDGVEEKDGEPGPSGNSMILKEESIADKRRGQNPVQKKHFGGIGRSFFSDLF